MQEFGASNPYAHYEVDFTSFWSFGEAYARWVDNFMLDRIMVRRGAGEKVRAVDIGAGTCQWTVRFLAQERGLEVVAVEPSRALLEEQRVPTVVDGEDVSGRLRPVLASAEEFARSCAAKTPVSEPHFDCIYFMQSAHYIAESDLPLLLRDLAQVLRPGSGRVIFQARNMHPHWWPWRFPKEWTPYVREALKPLYRLADRYERQLRELPQLFANVAVDTLPFRVELPAEDYWRRLEGRFIMPILGAGVLPEQVHKEGLQAMIDRYERAGKRTVDWEERFTVVSAVRT